MGDRIHSTRLASLQVAAIFLCWGVPDASPAPPVSPKIRLPDFLVIGAMKCGTTTLYRDLLTVPGLYLPDKESNALLAADPGAAYSKLFARASATLLTGEVCPDYTKPGLGDCAAGVARRLFPSGQAPRLVMLVRDPIARLLSHHHFISTQHGDANPGGMTRDLGASLRDFPELVTTSRYAARLRPWLDAFGPASLKVVRFEDYIADRRGTVVAIARFIGLPDVYAVSIESDRVFNAGDSRPVATPGWRKLLWHPLYRQMLRPLLPPGLRESLRVRLLPRAPHRPPPPDLPTLLTLAETLRPDVAELSRLLGRDEPLWDLDAAARSLSSAPK